VKCVGNGAVYELMRDAEELCEVIRRGLHVDPAGVSRRCWPLRQESPQSQSAVMEEIRGTFSSLGYSSASCYDGQLQADQLRVDGSVVTLSCQDLTTVDYDDVDRLSDTGCSSTTAAAGLVRQIIPPSVVVDDDDESLRSSMIANKVKSLNVDYDAHFTWRRYQYC